jgi:hypothetical protein
MGEDFLEVSIVVTPVRHSRWHILTCFHSAAIVEDINGICNEDPSSAYAYFFFDGGMSRNEFRLHGYLFRSLIRQFSSKWKNDVAPMPLEDLYMQCHDGGSQPSIEDLQKVLLAILDKFQHVYIVIDGVDQCPERNALLKWIRAMITWRNGKLHLLVTSRAERDIINVLSPYDSVGMVPDDVNADIKLYVDHVLQNDEVFGQLAPDIRSNLRTRLLASAGGMYIPLPIHALCLHHSLHFQVSLGFSTA